MRTVRRLMFCTAIALPVFAIAARAQAPIDDTQALTQFQRAADAYAFQHRQVQRQAGGTVDRAAMATAIRSGKVVPEEGTLFTPPVAAMFRNRIASVSRRGCVQPTPSSAVVPRAGEDASGVQPISPCLSAALPRLPEELEYRVAGVTLVLVDIHANLIVDILHAAFPPPAP